MTAAFLILLLFGVVFAYLVAREDKVVSDTFEYAPKTIQELKELNQTLYGTSSPVSP